jgi:WD40 repeat protein
MKTGLIIAIVVAASLAAVSGPQARSESDFTLALSGEVVRGPLAFSPGGQILVTGADGRSLQLRNATSGELTAKLAIPKGLGPVAISPDGTVVACARSDGLENVILLMDVETGREAHTLRGHSRIVQSIAFSPDGTTLASGSSDKTIRLWDTQTGDLRLTLSQPDQIIAGQRNLGIPGMVFSVAFSPDGTLLASGGGDGVGEYGIVVLWDIPSGKQRMRLLGSGEEQVWAVAFSPDQNLLVSGGVNGTVMVIDVSSGAITRHWHAGEQLRSLAISADGRVVATGLRREIKLWNLETGGLQKTLSGHDNWVGSLSFSADGKLLASASSNGVKLWDVAKQ